MSIKKIQKIQIGKKIKSLRSDNNEPYTSIFDHAVFSYNFKAFSTGRTESALTRSERTRFVQVARCRCTNFSVGYTYLSVSVKVQRFLR